MKLEQQVVNLELSKKLKKLGVKQESLWYWIIAEKVSWIIENNSEILSDKDKQHYSAFTIAELGELLPQVFEKEEELYYIEPNANGNGLRFMDYVSENGIFLRAYPLIEAKTEADARAKMLIYLYKNKLIN